MAFTVLLLGLAPTSALAKQPVCDAGGGCETSAFWSPLTDDTQWETTCGDGFFYSGIVSGNQECVICPC